MNDDNFDHIPMKSIWKITALVTIGDMTSPVTCFAIINDTNDHPAAEQIIDSATGGLATRIRLQSVAIIGEGVAIDFTDGCVVVNAGGEA